MKDLSRIEKSILQSLDKILNNNEKLRLEDIDELVETDEILRIRELVFYLDLLSQKSYVELEKDYYKENESVAFKYVNSAVSININKIKLTQKTLDCLKGREDIETRFSQSYVFAIITYVLTFVFGMMAMYIVMAN